jgi:hypothetical protein
VVPAISSVRFFTQIYGDYMRGSRKISMPLLGIGNTCTPQPFAPVCCSAFPSPL